MKKLTAILFSCFSALVLSAALPEPVLDLPLNTGDFATIKDEVNKCKVQVVNTSKLAWGEGPDGKALQFNGDKAAPRGAVVVTLPNDFKMSKGFTLRMIYKTSEDYARKNRYQLFQYGPGADKITGLSIFMYWRSIMCRFGQQSKTSISTPVHLLNLAPSTWYDCVVTFDGKNMAIYVNGKQLTQPKPAAFPDPKRNTICIGAGTTGGSGYAFKGLISSVVIYPRALSADEISNL